MDLLGDLGTADQLTSTRAENAVLKEKVKKLEERCKFLTVENATLQAEVEMYRQEFASGGGMATKTSEAPLSSFTTQTNDRDHFVRSGNDVFAKSSEVLLKNLHGVANPSCCSLSSDDTLLATGGADQNLTLCPWGAALGGQDAVSLAVRIHCGAPLISVDFARKSRAMFCAVGCMDGTVHVVHYSSNIGGLEAKEIDPGTIKHSKYVRTVAWSSSENLLASASADGNVQVHKIIWNGLDDHVQLEKVETLNLSGPVESLCFHKDSLVCYARGTSYLSYFDVTKQFEHVKRNLNQGPGNAGFDDHVSFAVMDMAACGDYLALATDTSRNIIIEFATGKQVRNLYGHKNDGFSQPKIAWSKNGQYLYGNTQEDSSVCVWDIASEDIVERLEGHSNPVRDMFSSGLTDTLVTTSFDKNTNIWLPPN